VEQAYDFAAQDAKCEIDQGYATMTAGCYPNGKFEGSTFFDISIPDGFYYGRKGGLLKFTSDAGASLTSMTKAVGC